MLWFSEDYLKSLRIVDPELVTVLQTCAQQKTYLIRCATPSSRQTLENYLRMMWQESQNNACCKSAQLYGLSMIFLVHLNRIVADEQLLTHKYRQSDGLLDQVTAYIREHYRDNITLHEVAEHFFISPSNIESLLTKGIGMPFYRYVTQCRVIHAQELISSGMPLKGVGLACGYHDYSNFYRAFIRETGTSPSQYRKRNALDPLPNIHTTETDQEVAYV